MHEQGQIWDSKEFYAPIITPYEAQLAFSPLGTDTIGPYRQDFAGLLEEQPQVSLAARLHIAVPAWGCSLHRFVCVHMSSHQDKYSSCKEDRHQSAPSFIRAALHGVRGKRQAAQSAMGPEHVTCAGLTVKGFRS